tara:strand:- start:12141 stop:12353 length:213 start_codon:yes stop_codon:yes gene_type:complete
MNMNASKARLAGSTKELSRKWEATRAYWRDQKALEFEARYLSGLFENVDTAVTVIDKLDKIVAKVRKDCE